MANPHAYIASQTSENNYQVFIIMNYLAVRYDNK